MKTRSKKVTDQIEALAVGQLSIMYLGMGPSWMVPSETDMGAFYVVHWSKSKGWQCSCRGFRFNARSDGLCHHIDECIPKLARLIKKAKGVKKRSKN